MYAPIPETQPALGQEMIDVVLLAVLSHGAQVWQNFPREHPPASKQAAQQPLTFHMALLKKGSSNLWYDIISVCSEHSDFKDIVCNNIETKVGNGMETSFWKDVWAWDTSPTKLSQGYTR